MRTALVVGGADGIGLAIATELAKEKGGRKIYIVDRCMPQPVYHNDKFEYHIFDLNYSDYSIFAQFKHVDVLMITARMTFLFRSMMKYSRLFWNAMVKISAKRGRHSYDYKLNSGRIKE